jgi:AcrR family transcriptional regulator
MAPADVRGTEVGRSARERIVASAYELFTRRGIRAVGMDEVIERAAAARATVYRHFASKDELVLAVLQRRQQLWTHDLIEEQSRLRGNSPEDQLLAIFDVLQEWFRAGDGYDGCSFIRVLLEMGPAHPAGRASIAYMQELRTIVRQRAQAAGLLDTDDFARSFHILVKGSIVAATEGDLAAADRAQSMARLLIQQHRPAVSSHI